MFCMWIVGAAIFYLLFPLSISESLIMSACITPTDPILVNGILHGKFAEQHISWNIRKIIAAESGANDGFAIPYLYLPLMLSGKHHQHVSWMHDVTRWFLHIVLWQTVVSLLVGGLIGWLASKALKFSRSRDLIDKDSFLTYSIALSFHVTGLLRLMHSNDLLAVFATGVVFAWDDWFVEETKEARFQEVIDLMLSLSFFIMYGVLIPWNEFAILGYGRLLAMLGLLLAFRRLPCMLILYPAIPCICTKKEALFTGWFGPIGVGALYYATLVLQEIPEMKISYVVVNFCVLSSILIHGITMPLFQLTMNRALYLPRSYMSSPILPHPQLLDDQEEEERFNSSQVYSNLEERSDQRSVIAMKISE